MWRLFPVRKADFPLVSAGMLADQHTGGNLPFVRVSLHATRTFQNIWSLPKMFLSNPCQKKGQFFFLMHLRNFKWLKSEFGFVALEGNCHDQVVSIWLGRQVCSVWVKCRLLKGAEIGVNIPWPKIFWWRLGLWALLDRTLFYWRFLQNSTKSMCSFVRCEILATRDGLRFLFVTYHQPKKSLCVCACMCSFCLCWFRAFVSFVTLALYTTHLIDATLQISLDFCWKENHF